MPRPTRTTASRPRRFTDPRPPRYASRPSRFAGDVDPDLASPRAALGHLCAAIADINEEIGMISIVGRPLTAQEARRLDNLESANVHTQTAVDTLAVAAAFPNDDNTPGAGDDLDPIPSDGRYAVANDNLVAEVRIDVDGLSIVSADLFARAAGHREFLASLRSQPGFSPSPDDNPLAVVVEDKDGRRAEGRIRFASEDGDQITVAITVHSPITGLPQGRAVVLAGRFESNMLRQLGVEVENQRNQQADPEWQHDRETMTISTAFRRAGIELVNIGQRDEIPAPRNDMWDLAKLHGLMTDMADEPLDRIAWNLRLLMLDQAGMVGDTGILEPAPGLLGIMFDTGRQDSNQLPRQGVAVFQRGMQHRKDLNRKMIQTAVHELGHSLNLAHRFEREVGRADSLSFMNYDWRYLGGSNRENFWRDFDFRFDRDELAFLLHGPWPAITPGGADFRTVPYWENTDGGYSPYRMEIPTDELELALSAPNDGLFRFAQPVSLALTLTNRMTRPFDIPSSWLDPKSGFLQLIVKREVATPSADSDARAFRPIAHRCFDLDERVGELVRVNESISNHVNLTFGSGGFTFAEPGNYRVTAVLELPISREKALIVKSQPIQLRITFPKTMEEERDGQLMFREDVGLYLMLGGSDLLDRAESDLEEMAERKAAEQDADSPLVVAFRRCQAINHSRDFIRYQNGRYRTRSAAPDKAAQIMVAVQHAVHATFDAHTARTTNGFIEGLQEALQEKKK